MRVGHGRHAWNFSPGTGIQLVDHGRAAALMDEAGIDAILAHTPLNAGYLADFWVHASAGMTLPGQTDNVIQFVGLPADATREPFLTGRTGAHASDMGVVDPWIRDRYLFGPAEPVEVRVMPAGTTRPISATAEEAAALALSDRGLDSARLGIEMSTLGAGILERLRTLLPGAAFVDATAILAQLRMIKGPEEVRRLELACEGTKSVLSAIRSNLWTLPTGERIAQVVHETAANLGMQTTFCDVHPNVRSALQFMPDAQQIVHGEPVSVDLGLTYLGYTSDMAHTLCAGVPSARVVKVHEALRDVVDVLAQACAPGVRCSEVHAAGAEALAHIQGVEVLQASMGHGFGRHVHEQPLVDPSDRSVLEEGMTITLELPVWLRDEGWLQLAESYVITARGSRSLAPGTLDILIG